MELLFRISDDFFFLYSWTSWFQVIAFVAIAVVFAFIFMTWRVGRVVVGFLRYTYSVMSVVNQAHNRRVP